MSLPFCPENQEVWNSPDHVKLVSGARENGEFVYHIKQGLEVHSNIRRDSLTKNSLSAAPKSPNNFDSFSSTGTVPPFLLTPLPLITDSKLHLLWPQPQEILQTEGPPFKTRGNPLSVVLDAVGDTTALHASLDIWDVHRENFLSLGVECTVEDVVCPEANQGGTVSCHLSTSSHSRFESYKLIITDKLIRILSPDVRGLHYALCTLGQLFSLYNEDGEICVPALYIHDWPQLQHRAILLDFSPAARKPDLETLKGYIKVMSFLKLRQLHCFYNLESGFPFSNRALLDLSRYCRRHLVDIVPVIDSDTEVEAEAIGRSLLCLVALFSTKIVQIGSVLSRKILSSKEMMSSVLMLLSDCKIFLSFDPTIDSLSTLPLNFAFVEDNSRVDQDFDSGAKRLMLAGFDVCVESQTASQGSIAGRSEPAVPIMHRAAFSSSSHRGSFGLLISDRQTLPHPSPFCFSWPGILLGLGLAWNTSVHEDYLHARLPELLNRHVYRDPEQVLGYLNVELGRLEDFFHGAVTNNGSLSTPSVLYQMTVDPDVVQLDHFTLDLLQQVIRHVKKFEAELSKSKPTCGQHAECILEVKLAMNLLLFACRLGKALVSTGLNPSGDSCGLAVINVGVSNLPSIARTDLANRLLSVRELFRAVWLGRNLPRGMETSLSVLDALLRRLVPEGTPLPSDVPPNADD